MAKISRYSKIRCNKIIFFLIPFIRDTCLKVYAVRDFWTKRGHLMQVYMSVSRSIFPWTVTDISTTYNITELLPITAFFHAFRSLYKLNERLFHALRNFICLRIRNWQYAYKNLQSTIQAILLLQTYLCLTIIIIPCKRYERTLCHVCNTNSLQF